MAPNKHIPGSEAEFEAWMADYEGSLDPNVVIPHAWVEAWKRGYSACADIVAAQRLTSQRATELAQRYLDRQFGLGACGEFAAGVLHGYAQGVQAGPPVDAVALLREYLRTADPEELKADWAAVEAMGLPDGPTLTEVLGETKLDQEKPKEELSTPDHQASGHESAY